MNRQPRVNSDKWGLAHWPYDPSAAFGQRTRLCDGQNCRKWCAGYVERREVKCFASVIGNQHADEILVKLAEL